MRLYVCVFVCKVTTDYQNLFPFCCRMGGRTIDILFCRCTGCRWYQSVWRFCDVLLCTGVSAVLLPHARANGDAPIFGGIFPSFSALFGTLFGGRLCWMDVEHEELSLRHSVHRIAPPYRAPVVHKHTACLHQFVLLLWGA